MMERKLTAILCADVCGYSRLMGQDEETTLRTLSSYRKVVDSLIEQHRGRFVNSAGDSVFAEFLSVVNAVQCAVEIQNTLNAENSDVQPDRRMQFRIGVNLGDVMVEGEQIYGDGVNVAARLESLATPGGICISRSVHENIKNRLPLNFEDCGEQAVKNIGEPVHVWRVLLDGALPAPRSAAWMVQSYWRGGVLSLTGLVIIAVTIVVVQHLSLKPQHTHASIPPSAKPALTLPDKPSIAVLPFVNMSGDPEQEYFSDGITDDLTTYLSRLPGLFVIARNSSFTYKGKSAKLQDVGNELGVKYVLQGSVRKAGGQVRITVQLADASTGAELWAERYERPLRNVFKLQDEIVHRIVTTSNLQLNLAQQGVVIPRSTENLEAYDDLLRGTEYNLAAFTKDSNTKARQMFEKALTLDPRYALAYADLGFSYWLAWVIGIDSNPNTVDRVLKLEQQAVVLDDSLAYAHSLMAEIYLRVGKTDSAMAEAERGIALDPNSASGYYWLAHVLNQLGTSTAALKAVEKAIRLDPRNISVYLMEQGWAYTGLGLWDEAISSLKAYQARYPANFFTHVLLAEDYAGLGDQDAARDEVAELQRVVASQPNSAMGYLFLAVALNATGRPAESLAAAEKFIRLDPRERGFYLWSQCSAYSQLGRWQEAVSIVKGLPPPTNPWFYVWLAVDYVELGRLDAARAEIAEVLKLEPQFSLKLGLAAFPTEQTRAAADLRKAGLK